MKTEKESRPPGKVGFTLIELLVVMAIVSILAAMILPVIQTAKEKARGAKCISNLRQIGHAIYGYQAQFDGYIPPGDCVFGHDIWNQSSLTGQYGPTNLGYLIVAGLLPMPKSDDHVFYCPSLTRATAATAEASGKTSAWFTYGPPNPFGMQNWGKSGIVNIGYDYRDSLDDELGRPVDISRDTRRAMVSDICTRPYGQFAHGNVYHVWYLDGHVGIYPDEKTYISRTVTDGWDDSTPFKMFDKHYR